jgi:hypothetical protein
VVPVAALAANSDAARGCNSITTAVAYRVLARRLCRRYHAITMTHRQSDGLFATSIGAVGALLFSFAAVANPLTVKAVEARTAIAAAPGEQTRTAILTEINGAFVSGDRIGEVRAGTDCSEVVERESPFHRTKGLKGLLRTTVAPR